MKNIESVMYTIENNGKVVLAQEIGTRCVCLTEGNELVDVELVWSEASLEDHDLMDNEEIYVIERDDGKTVLIQENGTRCVCLTEGNELVDVEIAFQF